MLLSTLYFGASLFVFHAGALKVTPGSDCAILCVEEDGPGPTDLTVSSTKFDELSCQDKDYSSEAQGIKYKNCLKCLQSSNATSDNEDDTSWFLYNLRYTIDTCLYGVPKKIDTVSSPCNIDYNCKPLKTALTAGNLDPNRDQYEYCDADNGILSGKQVDNCIQCFQSTTNQAYFANFMTALKAGCQQRPAPGTPLQIDGTLFSDSLVQLPDLNTPNATLYHVEEKSGLQTGAIVGIAVGAALLIFGATGLFWVYHRKQKKFFSDHESSDTDSTPKKKSINETSEYPAQKKSAIISDYELRSQRAYTGNTEYYDKLEKQMQAQRSLAMAPSHLVTGVPRHSAHLVPAHGRHSSQTASIQPPSMPTNAYNRNSYTLQTYLNTSQDPNTINHRPSHHSRGPSLPTHTTANSDHNSTHNSSSRRQPGLSAYNNQTAHSRSHSAPRPSYPSSSSTQPQSQHHHHHHQNNMPLFPVPPPPQGPPPPQAPTLSLPSVPRIKVPKQYDPPQINVQGATPIENKEEEEPGTVTFGASFITASSTPLPPPPHDYNGAGVGVDSRAGSRLSSRGPTPSPEPGDPLLGGGGRR